MVKEEVVAKGRGRGDGKGRGGGGQRGGRGGSRGTSPIYKNIDNYFCLFLQFG